MKTALALLSLLALFSFPSVRAATIVKVEYQLDGKPAGRVTYTGGDGWKAAKYWGLLDDEPMFAYEMKIKPDKPGALTATLKGKVKVAITIRNSIKIGTAETDKLTFIRKDKDSEKWFLSKEETKRLVALVKEMKKKE